VTSVYNLLRETAGISQSEAAEHMHGTSLDTVKAWCSDRRPAPSWAINELQRLVREIERAGDDYAEMIKTMNQGNVYVIGMPRDKDDARACGFPSVAAQMRAIAIAITKLPDDAEIRLVERVRGAIPAPLLEKEKMNPTATDSQVLQSMQFTNGKFYTAGNMNRRKFERLEEIGWIKGISTNISDVEYYITQAGRIQAALTEEAESALRDFPDPAPGGFQSGVNPGPRRHQYLRLTSGTKVRSRGRDFDVESIDGDVVTARLESGELAKLHAPAMLLPRKGIA
jgi:hypothetical protein